MSSAWLIGLPFIVASSSAASASKVLAVEFISGISSKGSIEFDAMMAFQKIGPGM